MSEIDTRRKRLERLQSVGCADYLHMALLDRAEKAEAERDDIPALLAAEREKALREAADEVHMECWTDGDGGPATDTLLAEQATTAIAVRAILALIDTETPAQPKPDAVQVHGSDRNMVVALINRYGLGAVQSGKLLATIDSLAEGDTT